MTDQQKKLLRYFMDGRAASVPPQLRPELRWAMRRGYMENTRRTTGIANTRGGVQWRYQITDAGRTALAQTEAA